MTERPQPRGNIKDERAWLSIHAVGQVLVMNPWKLHGIPQRHLGIAEPYPQCGGSELQRRLALHRARAQGFARDQTFFSLV
jgi:hypothetical protein